METQQGSDPEDPHNSILHMPWELLQDLVPLLSVADCAAMARSCRPFHVFFQPQIFPKDIEDEEFKSLLWACCNGDADFARRALEAGARPNAFFCTCTENKCSWSLWDPFSRLTPGEQALEKYPHFVHSTRRIRAPGLSEGSALTLATACDHPQVIKVLLDAGAKTREYHPKHMSESRDVRPYEPEKDTSSEHGVVFSYARSGAAVKTLAEHGERDDIMNSGNARRMFPIQVALIRSSSRLTSTGPIIAEPELYELVKAMLIYTPGLRYCIGEPQWSRIQSRVFDDAILLLAMGTGSSRIFKHIYRDCRPPEKYEGFLEMRDLVITELIHPGFLRQQGEHFNARVDLSREESLAMFSVILRREYPSRQPMACGVTALGMAIMVGNREIVNLIRNEDRRPGIDCTLAVEVWATRWQALDGSPELVSSYDDPLDSTYLNGIHYRLLQEADINGRCFFEQGFTPLMIATGDLIQPGTFRTLLEHGADPSLTGRLHPTVPAVSVLQCLLQGFPNAIIIAGKWFDEDKLRQLRLPLGHSSIQYQNLPVPLIEIAEQTRKAKMRAFIQHTQLLHDDARRTCFYTPNGKHILNWATEKLDQTSLQWALDVLMPIYWHTRRSDDNDHSWLHIDDLEVTH
ncbi:hypothetical protein ACHAPU_007968 [Fusarium lateritium]